MDNLQSRNNFEIHRNICNVCMCVCVCVGGVGVGLYNIRLTVNFKPNLIICIWENLRQQGSCA